MKLSVSFCVLISVFVLASPAMAAKFARIEKGAADVLQGPGVSYPAIKKLQEGDRVLASNAPVDGFFKIRTKMGVIGWVAAERIVIEKKKEVPPTADVPTR